jgi:streptomycin 6-kinase
VDKRGIEVPALVRQKVAHLGEQGERWLAGLPGLIADVERLWSITVGRPLTGGTASYVARARTTDGHDAVLKLAIPGQDFARQVYTIANANGRGYVCLLAHDNERHAMLLEALGPSMDHVELTPERTIEALCAMLRQAWQVSRPSGLMVMPAEEKARGLGRLVSRLWEKLDRPCSLRVATQALQFAERRAAAFDLDQCVVVHGDPHPGNALRVLAPRAGAESGFVFVDPDGFLAAPAYDLGVVLRNWCPQLLATDDAPGLAHRYCALLAAESGVDEVAIWEWGFLERVSTGLYVLDFGARDLGRPFLDTAERLV